MILEEHLQGFFRKAGGDRRLRRPHLCLYLALLPQSQGSSFVVNRKEVMARARIGSRVTYHRCMRELDKWGYIYYLPSYDPASKSRVFIKPLGVEEAKTSKGSTEMRLGFTWL